MTIYLFIDLPFNEIGCYPTSLRDGERNRKKIRGGEGKAGLLLRGQLISCFSFWLLSAWIHSHSMSARKYERSNGLHSGRSFLSYNTSSHFSLFASHSLLWSHYIRIHLSHSSFFTKTSLSYPFLHNEGPPINFGAVKRDAASATPPHSLQIYELIWVYEDRVGWGVPSVCHHTSRWESQIGVSKAALTSCLSSGVWPFNWFHTLIVFCNECLAHTL